MYPIMFAVLVGRSLKSTALHMAQRGTTLLRLEQVGLDKFGYAFQLLIFVLY